MAGAARGNSAKTQAAPLARLPASRRRCPSPPAPSAGQSVEARGPPPVAVLPAPAPRFPITSRAFYDLYGTHRIPGAARGDCRNVGLAPPNFAGHARAGCVSVSVTRNQDDPNNFACVELWDRRAHYEQYFAWRDQTGVLRELATLVDGEASFRFFDIVGL